METINHTKIKQWIEKTIEVLEAPEEFDFNLEQLKEMKRQANKLERTEGLTKTEKEGIKQIIALQSH